MQQRKRLREKHYRNAIEHEYSKNEQRLQSECRTFFFNEKFNSLHE